MNRIAESCLKTQKGDFFQSKKRLQYVSKLIYFASFVLKE
jgi:hypothetical protein